MPHSPLTKSLLDRESVFHEVRGGEIVVAGNDAARFADVFHVETRRPMQNGVLNPQEAHSLPVVRSIIAKMLGRAGGAGRRFSSACRPRSRERITPSHITRPASSGF